MANRLLLGLKSVPVVKLRRNKVIVHGAHTCKLHCRFPIWQSRWQSRDIAKCYSFTTPTAVYSVASD